ncbi:hypoxanthine/guanine phosphoribosyltransferase [Methanobacterium petrolearium]|uniref:hypoxanthine/guanine phosphoribosyltransferase n=1 Tax=Methanobacterium petrolearium TaxID=710190 RepID=UPI001AE54ED8|nr:hypoxanthine/guanine phosphoribosyltransferase [Methanobacterium petrolearium]MBP1944709.1 adenine phosphoribosyltransferase [Methanobacterium petrolearium]BDZ69974.1 adenine phosphoribosyltransferase [Methanobacterium petrolearium]
MLEKLTKSLVEAPIVKKGDYNYFVHPITDGVPLVEADVLEEVAVAVSQFADLDVDKIVCVEAMGIHLATAISILTDIPFVVVRKRSYGLEGEVAVHQTTGYSEGELYINGIKKGDRVFLVDDVVSTGGTMSAVIQALQRMGTKLVDVMAIIEKGEGKELVEKNTGVKVNTLVRANVVDGKVVIEEITAGKQE